MPSNVTSLIAELNTLLRLTNNETAIAETRRAQAGSEAIAKELARNADKSRERARLIATAIRELGGLPNLLGAAAGRFGALAKTQLEQGVDLSEALLSDLALEQQLYARARFVKVLAEAANHRNVIRVAERLERAHAETIEWLEIRLAEIAVGGPPAIRPTPVQSVVGAARKAAVLPLRGAATGVNRSISTLQRVRETAAETLEEQLEKAGELREAAAEIYTAGRNASLKRAERVAADDGAGNAAKAIHSARGAAGALDESELPIRNYDTLNATQAAAKIKSLDSADDVRAILGYEQAHGARSSVISAAQAQLGAIARDVLDDRNTKSATKKATRSSGRKQTPAQRRAKLADLTVEELRDKAAKADVEGRSSMSKDELVGALAKA